MKLSTGRARIIRGVLEELAELATAPAGLVSRAREAVAFLRPRTGRSVLKYRAPEPVPNEQPTMAEIAQAVRDRAGGICEACRRPFTPHDPFSVDHWLNGNGRRRQLQSAATCWGLHKYSCHPDRQHYRIPEWADEVWRAETWSIGLGVRFWNFTFLTHCERQSPALPFAGHIEHQPVRRRA